MKLNFKKGFSLAEALVGFSLFSLMLMLYLPAFYTEMVRTTHLKLEMEHWRVFYELVQDTSQRTLADSLQLEDFGIYRETVQSFHCEPAECSISFTDGSVYHVSLHEINQ